MDLGFGASLKSSWRTESWVGHLRSNLSCALSGLLQESLGPFGPEVSPRVSPRVSPKWGGSRECLTGCLRWKATKEYLNQRGTKIRVFLSGPFPPTLFLSFFPPLPPWSPVHFLTTSPLFASPFIPPFLTPGKLRFRYPSDLGTL